MLLVIKLAIFIFCIRHVIANGRPLVTAAIYAGAFLIIGLLFMFAQPVPAMYIAALGITFLYDLGTGFIFFWLIDRFQDSCLALALVIFLGIAASLSINYILAARL